MGDNIHGQLVARAVTYAILPRAYFVARRNGNFSESIFLCRPWPPKMWVQYLLVICMYMTKGKA